MLNLFSNLNSRLLFDYCYRAHPNFPTSTVACSRVFTMSSQDIPDVDVDEEGRFKYILIKVTNKNDPGDEKCIVRGYSRCEWHNDIFAEVEPKIKEAGFMCEVLGGGKLLHQPTEKQLCVFGTSTGYGKADHDVSAQVLKKHYKDYNVTVDKD